MFLAFAVLLMAWFIDMPLWVSIFVTVMAGLTIAIKFFHGFMDIIRDYIQMDDKNKEN